MTELTNNKIEHNRQKTEEKKQQPNKINTKSEYIDTDTHIKCSVVLLLFVYFVVAEMEMKNQSEATHTPRSVSSIIWKIYI